MLNKDISTCLNGLSKKINISKRPVSRVNNTQMPVQEGNLCLVIGAYDAIRTICGPNIPVQYDLNFLQRKYSDVYKKGTSLVDLSFNLNNDPKINEYVRTGMGFMFFLNNPPSLNEQIFPYLEGVHQGNTALLFGHVYICYDIIKKNEEVFFKIKNHLSGIDELVNTENLANKLINGNRADSQCLIIDKQPNYRSRIFS